MIDVKTGEVVALVSLVVVVLDTTHAAGSVLEYAGWAVAMHLWFLAVYLVVVSLTPIAVAAQRRWGLWVPALLGVGVAVVDVARISGHVYEDANRNGVHESKENPLAGWQVQLEDTSGATVAPRYGGPGTGLAGTVEILRVLGCAG